MNMICNLKRALLSFLCLAVAAGVYAQRRDSTLAIGGITRDTHYIIHENVRKHKFLGNSWYLASGFNYSKRSEFDLNLGRTYGSSFCGGAGCAYTMKSWGGGLGLAMRHGKTAQLAKAFWEYSFFYFPPISAGIRAEYVYDISANTHYLRPSAGLSLFFVDILYHYSFMIRGTENLFRHGVTLRIKYFHRQRNWQHNYPSRC